MIAVRLQVVRLAPSDRMYVVGVHHLSFFGEGGVKKPNQTAFRRLFGWAMLVMLCQSMGVAPPRSFGYHLPCMSESLSYHGLVPSSWSSLSHPFETVHMLYASNPCCSLSFFPWLGKVPASMVLFPYEPAGLSVVVPHETGKSFPSRRSVSPDSDLCWALVRIILSLCVFHPSLSSLEGGGG